MKVLVWNIERLGDKFATDTEGSAISTLLIASLIVDLDASVVLIQELREKGVPVLKSIKDLLAAWDATDQWKFDWIKGGITSGSSAVAFSDTSFKVTNNEGYAVLWKDNCLVKTKAKRSGGANSLSVHARAAAPISYIDLSLMGKRLTPARETDEPRLTRGKTFHTSGYPLPGCGTANARSMKALNRGSAMDEYDWTPDKKVQVVWGSRRPVIVTVDCEGHHYDIIGYHAPNDEFATMYGPFIAINAKVPSDAASRAIAGDWNTVTTAARACLASTATHDPYTLTSPQLDDDGAPPAGSHGSIVKSARRTAGTWRQKNGVYSNHRDFSLLASPDYESSVPALVAYFHVVNGTGPKTVKSLKSKKAKILAQLTANVWPSTTRDGVTNEAIITSFFKCMATYDGTPATDQVFSDSGHKADFSTAFALLMTRYVSDHLPVVLEITP